MLVEITGTSLTKSEVTLTATNLEAAILNPLKAFDTIEEVEFVFSIEDRPAQFKYLFTLMRSNKKCKEANNLSEMVSALEGQFLNLPESFLAE